MAEVLCPILPSNSPIPTAQQARPATPDNYPRGSSVPQNQTPPRLVQMPRNNYHTTHNGGATGYRGTSTAPTYAFKATPTLKNDSRQTGPQNPPSVQGDPNRQRYPGPPSVSTTSSSTTSSNPSSAPSTNTTVSTWSQLFSKNDSSLTSNFEVAPFTTSNNAKSENKPAPIPEAPSDAFPPLAQTPSLNENSTKSTPGRYRRNKQKAESPPAAVETQDSSTPMNQTTHIIQPANTMPKLTTDIPTSEFNARDLESEAAASSEPQASAGAEQKSSSHGISSLKRYRRRSSVNTLNNESNNQLIDPAKVAPSSPAAERPSSPLRPPSSKQNQRSPSPSRSGVTSNRTDGSTGPARTFAEVARRTNTPSPLSRPMTPDQASRNINPSSPPAGPASNQNGAFQNSPAVAAMAALNDKDGKGKKSSRLRRAFSFGSGAELKRATGDNDDAKEKAQARREQFSNELDEEQAHIARQQEAAGLGESIYSGQAGFVGSTDNLSISSTASSASLMLRKMGKGMKKGGRSIKGLFRPKSAIGVAPPDGPLGAGVGDISRVTVEAEREKVNVNSDPRDQNGGGTGFPKLERNSMDATAIANGDLDRGMHFEGTHDTRKSIVGGEQERAEVLASVKRSILKRSTTGSPVASPTIRTADAPFSHNENPSVERRTSPVPSNSSNEPRKMNHIRTDMHAPGEDYFGRRFGNHSSRSLPGTPHSVARGISFSPRIQFHDVWSSTEYDRRGDIATCNRLTPMLAQQIKEELNTFKMEMEVHEASKPHTHFF